MVPETEGVVRPSRCLIGCGANLGSRREQLDQAIDMLRFMPGVEMLQVSRFVETQPIGGPPGQPPFLNAACLVETSFAPEEMLDMLAAVENTLHRERHTRWGPRTIDLDLLMYDEQVITTERLQVPHPRMTTRRFVLEPATEIAADLRHPVAGCTLRELLENISQRHLHVAVVGVPGSGAAEVAAAVADVTLARLLHAPTALPGCSPATAHQAEPPATSRGWRERVEAYAAPLRESQWPDDPHGTVADYWLEGVRLAADAWLPPVERESFLSAFEQVSHETVCPHVVLFLEVRQQTLVERMAYRSHATDSSDVFADLVATQAATGGERGVADLLAFQEAMAECLLHGGGCCPRPKAVIRLAADDLGRTVLDAVAAVEAIA